MGLNLLDNLVSTFEGLPEKVARASNRVASFHGQLLLVINSLNRNGKLAEFSDFQRQA
jgi:hypothetical protein